MEVQASCDASLEHKVFYVTPEVIFVPQCNEEEHFGFLYFEKCIFLCTILRTQVLNPSVCDHTVGTALLQNWGIVGVGGVILVWSWVFFFFLLPNAPVSRSITQRCETSVSLKLEKGQPGVNKTENWYEEQLQSPWKLYETSIMFTIFS